MRAAAEALPLLGAGHLAGAVGGGGRGGTSPPRGDPSGRWAATPQGLQGAGVTAEPEYLAQLEWRACPG